MEPFLGEIRLFSFGFAPQGWMLCQGQLLSINSNTALYALLGTRYGGDGISTFALPNYSGRVPVHQTAGMPVGATGGEEKHTLTVSEMPKHIHTVWASANAGNSKTPNGLTWSVPLNDTSIYSSEPFDKLMASDAISVAGGSQPHNNMQPYTTLNYCIAVRGIFPPRD
ncbi:phage tail protein [Paenibacillus xylaniclasticus]|uniref:phage tail protein n=1 Tax=Paenibacillus xylaniclasticus TaxID=588083 RepID=UPI001757988E|nr:MULTISPECIES: tail fiber protein [Paenibacillus]GFN33782.1 tail Collar domain-containing protein [Paenibacillus curdlanolyticus]